MTPAGPRPPEVPPPDSPAAGDASGRPFPTVLEQLGGVSGIIASSVPVAVFVLVNVLFELRVAIISALVAGVVVAGWRISRKQPLQPAVSGLLGVGLAAYIAHRTGEARGFYLPGLIVSGVCAVAFLVSVLVRRPLAGVIWYGINGAGQTWRRDPRMLRAYTFATLLWALVFASRVIVQGLLYNADAETWLGIARLAMGYPLVGLAMLGTVWAVRRADSTQAA